MPGLGMDLSIRFDDSQFKQIMVRFDRLENLILQSIDDPKKLASLTDQLRQSRTMLGGTIDQINAKLKE